MLLFFITRIVPSIFVGRPPSFIQSEYLHVSTSFFMFLAVLSVSILFSGIICSDYKEKTGVTVYPLISKLKILIGKFVANFLILLIVCTVYYLLMGLYNYYFYGDILHTIFISFNLLILYLLALSSFTTFLSSFMPSAISVFSIITGYLITGILIIDPILIGLRIKIEPLFSITYLFNIILYVYYPNFTSIERYNNMTNQWLFPSLSSSLIIFTLVIIIFLILGFILFRRREF